MQAATDRFEPAAAEAARSAIEDAGGNEVFLLGCLAGGKVREVRVLARGNRQAVPAILNVPRPGEVVIHNHPTAPLVPSDADLQVASAIGNRGVGSYIVDNEMTRVYVVVEPWIEEEPPRIEPADAMNLLAPGGRIAATLPGYEERPQQLAMAAAVARAFNDSSVLTAEAGTGTGKSLAYLVPAILWARANQARVIVSTHTINLQEQLVHKDLPFLLQRAGLECRAALVKGRGNYLCRRKVAQLASLGAQLIEDELAREVAALLDWANSTGDGSLADLAIRPRAEVWEQVVSENDNCLRARCPHYSSCFFYAARRAAAAADVLVANHHLLMADLALRSETGAYTEQAVLPPATRVVIDEAHHLEDVATSYFGGHLGLAMLERNLGRLRHARVEHKGILPALLRDLDPIDRGGDAVVARGAANWIRERLLPRRSTVWSEAEEAFARILTAYVDHLSGDDRTDAGDKLRITSQVRESELWGVTSAMLGNLAAVVDAYAGEITGVLERTAQLFDPGRTNILYLTTELGAVQGRLASFAQALLSFTADDEEHCRWIELRRRQSGSVLYFHVAPIEVGPLLHRALFDPFDTAILTSATLAVGGRFDYLHQRLGIDRVDPPERSEAFRVDSPFDFSRQALLLVPDDLPDPGTPQYEASSQEFIRELLELTRGGTFVLFTAYGALNRAFTSLEEPLLQSGLTLLRQGDASRHLLLRQFAHEPGAVLFATDSFWEGVDVKGEALRCVVIARLPFKVPTEPIEQARVETIERRGGNGFLEHAVPQAVIKLKQGFGRLIRSREDRGCVVILDGRVVRKRYGKFFLDSLPPARRVIGPSRLVLHAVRGFFAE